MKRSRTTLTIFSLALAVLVFSSCGFRPKPVLVKNYVIDSGERLLAQITPMSNPLPHTLILTPVLGALPFRTQRIFYRTSEISLSPYLYSRWEYAPTHMLMTKMFRAISKANLFKAVTYRSTGAFGNLYLETTLFDFSHHVMPGGKASFGEVSVIFQLIDGTTRKVISSKMWTIRKPAPTLNAEGAAQALDAATNELCLDLITWLKETVRTLPANS